MTKPLTASGKPIPVIYWQKGLNEIGNNLWRMNPITYGDKMHFMISSLQIFFKTPAMQSNVSRNQARS